MCNGILKRARALWSQMDPGLNPSPATWQLWDREVAKPIWASAFSVKWGWTLSHRIAEGWDVVGYLTWHECRVEHRLCALFKLFHLAMEALFKQEFHSVLYFNISHICLLLSNPRIMTYIHLSINSLLPDHSVLHWVPSKCVASSSQVFQKPESDYSLSLLISAFHALCWSLLELSLPSSLSSSFSLFLLASSDSPIQSFFLVSCFLSIYPAPCLTTPF